MKEILPTIRKWTQANKPFALATVTKTWGSSPRPVGSMLVISREMEMAGSVSGGCVEGSVVKESLPLIQYGRSKLLSFGISNEEAWEVGLTCGGKVDVFVERFLAFDERKTEREVWEKLENCLENNQACVLVTSLETGNGRHSLVLPDGSVTGTLSDQKIRTEALRAYTERKNQVLELEGRNYFLQVFPRKSQLLIIGAAHITADLVELAKLYGFETIVIDPRGIFSSKTQFQVAPDQLFTDYPAEVLPEFTLDAYTYAVVLSHDPKIDDNALHLLLKSEVAYIGALGSRKTHAKRIVRLQEAGFTEAEISRIHSPVGVDIQAKTPKEIALSIMGEIIKVKNAFL